MYYTISYIRPNGDRAEVQTTSERLSSASAQIVSVNSTVLFQDTFSHDEVLDNVFRSNQHIYAETPNTVKEEIIKMGRDCNVALQNRINVSYAVVSLRKKN